jgi:diguanylate cyclase (GGDEF)-like protein
MRERLKVQADLASGKLPAAMTVSLFPIVPLAALEYVLHADIFPRLAPAADRHMEWLVEALILFSGLLILARCRSRRNSRQVDEAGREALPAQPLEARRAEIGRIVRSFAQMLETIETRTQEISRSAIRLDAAYKQLEAANARLEVSVNADATGKDAITGLHSRQFFRIRLEEEINRYTRFGHPVSVVMVDLDDVDAINGGQRSAAGDETLRDVADLLRKHSRGINVIARYGGDEFAVLLVETSKLGAQRYAERIRGIIASAAWRGSAVTASFGVASLPEDAPGSAEELLRCVHAALYAAKRRGKNSVASYEGTPSAPVKVEGSLGA